MSASPVHQITDALPAEAICVRLNVKERSIRLARERGVFPAYWYPGISELCAEHGVDCPMDAFKWSRKAGMSG